MYSESRFKQIEEHLETSSRDFDGSGTNDIKAQTLLITAVELNYIHKRRESEFEDVLEARHQYQVIFFLKGVQALFALYQLVKNHRYDSAYRDLRFLLETYFIIRGLNRDKSQAEEIAFEHLEEIQSMDDDMSRVERAEHEPEAVDKLFGVMRSERNRAEDASENLGNIYNYLSNRSTHPVRLDGAALDGSHNEVEEEQLLTFGLYFAYGLTREIYKTYSDTSAADMIQSESQPIVRRFDEVLGKNVPVFLTDKY